MRNKYKAPKQYNILVIFSAFLIAAISIGLTLHFLLSHLNSDKPQSTVETNFTQKNLISIVITDLGLSKELLEKASSLPENISFGVLPYSIYWQGINDLVQSRDILLNIPTESKDYFSTDNGPYALNDNLDKNENNARLNFVISQFPKASGFYLNSDTSYTNEIKNLNFLKEKIGELKSFFLYYTPNNSTIKNQKSEALNVDIIIPDSISPEKATFYLEQSKKVAQATGQAIIIIQVSHNNLNTLEKWLKSPSAQDVNLIRVKDLHNLMQK